ncbi:hypothetical protein PACTADRAFT_30280, partial [Pachysolen tannophilus NRRL Y-2460]
WTQEEYSLKRRLVRFFWDQVGCDLFITFEPVKQNEYQLNFSVVSCIFDQPHGKFFFTSVDFINLFEKIVDAKFKIDEKNRIRRNLQSLKPITITKQENRDFFNLIMEFPTPKPRNIEKNVKVFGWSSLPQAFFKIMSKYSCDFT